MPQKDKAQAFKRHKWIQNLIKHRKWPARLAKVPGECVNLWEGGGGMEKEGNLI